VIDPGSPPPDRPVLATYLHLTDPETFRPSFTDDPAITTMESRHPLVPFYRFLYETVGRDYWWVDRLRWTDQQIEAHLMRPSVTSLVL